MTQEELNQIAVDIFRRALEGVAAKTLLGRKPIDSLAARPLEKYQAIRLIAIGKGALPLAGAAEVQLPTDKLMDGLTVVPHGYCAMPLPHYEIHPSDKIKIREAGHPVPDPAGMSAAHEALGLAKATGPDDLLVVLISGGGSALLPAFAEGITLEDAQAVFKVLLRSGAAIHELNSVRKHISIISGGRLAAESRGEVIALAVSDVPGDDLSIISSGPTVTDSSTFGEAQDILKRFKIWEKCPATVRAHIERGLHDSTLESPKPGDPRLARTRTELLGNNADALQAGARAAEEMGIAVQIWPELIQGEAREVGKKLARIALEPSGEDGTRGKADALLFGGETTVTMNGDGFGGRNQEVALSATIELAGTDRLLTILSAGSDGVDGVAPQGEPAVAGAIVNPQTIKKARASGLDGEAYLAANNSYEFFKKLNSASLKIGPEGGALHTGPTHCNVMDIMLVLRGPAEHE